MFWFFMGCGSDDSTAQTPSLSPEPETPVTPIPGACGNEEPDPLDNEAPPPGWEDFYRCANDPTCAVPTEIAPIPVVVWWGGDASSILSFSKSFEAMQRAYAEIGVPLKLETIREVSDNPAFGNADLSCGGSEGYVDDRAAENLYSDGALNIYLVDKISTNDGNATWGGMATFPVNQENLGLHGAAFLVSGSGGTAQTYPHEGGHAIGGEYHTFAYTYSSDLSEPEACDYDHDKMCDTEMVVQGSCEAGLASTNSVMSYCQEEGAYQFTPFQGRAMRLGAERLQFRPWEDPGVDLLAPQSVVLSLDDSGTVRDQAESAIADVGHLMRTLPSGSSVYFSSPGNYPFESTVSIDAGSLFLSGVPGATLVSTSDRSAYSPGCFHNNWSHFNIEEYPLPYYTRLYGPVGSVGNFSMSGLGFEGSGNGTLVSAINGNIAIESGSFSGITNAACAVDGAGVTLKDTEIHAAAYGLSFYYSYFDPAQGPYVSIQNSTLLGDDVGSSAISTSPQQVAENLIEGSIDIRESVLSGWAYSAISMSGDLSFSATNSAFEGYVVFQGNSGHLEVYTAQNDFPDGLRLSIGNWESDGDHFGSRIDLSSRVTADLYGNEMDGDWTDSEASSLYDDVVMLYTQTQWNGGFISVGSQQVPGVLSEQPIRCDSNAGTCVTLD